MKKGLSKGKSFFWLGLIILVAAFLRLYRLESNPPSLNWDEVSHGYNAYSILKTGKDEWGIRLPLIFRAYGDYKLPLYIYLTVPWVGLLGLTAYSVRLVSVLSGMGLVAVAYFIGLRLGKNKQVGLLAAFLTAVSPWPLFLSRVAVEANLGAFLFSLAGCFFLKWWDSQKLSDLNLASLFWGLSLHAYNSNRILVLLLMLLGLFWFLRQKKARKIIFPLLILGLMMLPLVVQYFDETAKARFEWVNILDQGMIGQIIEKRTTSTLPVPLPTLLHNKATYFAYHTIKNYASNLSFKYLFFYGGSHYQFSLPNRELLFLVTAPFLILGLLRALKTSGKERFLALWFFLAFVPSAITRDAPHVLRTILVLPTPMILTSLGVKSVIDFLKEKSALKGHLVIFAFIFATGVSFINWWKDYFGVYPKAYSWAWQFGYQEAVSYLKNHYSDYQKVFFTKRYGEPHEFVAFYFPWEPESFVGKREWDYHANWYWTNGLERFVFVNDWEIKEGVSCDNRIGHCLLVTSPGNYPAGWSKIETIDFLDGRPAFEILEK